MSLDDDDELICELLFKPEAPGCFLRWSRVMLAPPPLNRCEVPVLVSHGANTCSISLGASEVLFTTWKTLGQKVSHHSMVEEMGPVASALANCYRIKITFQFLTSRLVSMSKDLRGDSCQNPVKCKNQPMVLRRFPMALSEYFAQG